MPHQHKYVDVAATFLESLYIMQKKQDQIDKLLAFRQRDKFSTTAWNDRGLNPSSGDLCNQLNTTFNSCSDKLVACLNTKSTDKRLKEVLKTTLFSLNNLDYDTEEKEFICDLFCELATITAIDFENDINKWLYGSLSTTLSKIGNLLKSTKGTEVLAQPCTRCGTKLKSQILQKDETIPDSNWFIIKCSVCKELNLLSPGPGVKEIRFVNYEWVDTLDKEEYNQEQAHSRLEQIRTFRKP